MSQQTNESRLTKEQLEQARFNMVEQQIRPWQVLDQSVLYALIVVKRELFVEDKYKNIAFADVEIPLPHAQKMLYPRVEARLVQELQLKKTDTVLEIGTGSAYVTALLAYLANFVYSMEIDAGNKNFAVANLAQLGIKNASVILGNGDDGYKEKAPFDKIFIGGACAVIPDTIKGQLKIGGRLVGFQGVKPVMHAVLIERLAEADYRETCLFEIDVDYLSGETSNKFKL